MPKILERLLRAGEGRVLKKLQGIAAQVNALEEDFEKLTDEELRDETDVFRKRLAGRRDPRRPAARGVRRRPRGQPSAPSASGTSTCRSWAARPCTWATSPR